MVAEKDRQHGDLANWAGLERLSDKFLVACVSWVMLKYDAVPGRCEPLGTRSDNADVAEFGSALLRESERRDWPEGWWEDPSVVTGLDVESEVAGG